MSDTSPTSHAPQDGPRWGIAGLTALLIATPLIPSEAVSQGTGVVLILAALLLLTAWAVHGLRRGSTALALGPVDGILGLFLAWHTLSALVMGPAGNARLAINVAWQWLAFGVIWFLARQWIREARTARAVVAVMLSLAVGLAAFGFYQCFYTMPRDRAAYERDPDAVLREAGVFAPPGSPVRAQYENRLRSREPIATFALTNSLAGLLAPWCLVALGLVAWLRHEQLGNGRALAGAGLAALLIGACLILTKSRSAYVGMMAGLFVLGAWLVRSRWRWDWKLPLGAVVALVFVVVAAAGTGFLDLAVLSEARKSLGYRWEYWTATVDLVRDHPWFGCGPGNFQAYYARYKLPQASEMVADPHNFVFELAATAGLPALFLGLALLAAWLGQWTRRSAATGSSESNESSEPGKTSEPNHPAVEPAAPRRGKRAAPPDATRRREWTSVHAVYGGALAGLLLGILAGVIGRFVPDLALLWTAVPVAAGVVWLLHDWVARGTLPVPLLVAALAALAVNLLAAGGIGFPGVIQTWWLLGAVVLNLREPAREARPLPRPASLVVLASGSVLLVGFFLTMYRPLLTGHVLLGEADQAWSAGRAEEAMASFAEAARVDPWNAEPWLRQARAHQRLWLQTGDPGERDRLLVAAIHATRRDSQNHVLRQELLALFLEAHRVLGDSEALVAAVGQARAAVKLFPNSSMGHAQLAWLYHLGRSDENAQAEARLALQLDELNPHSEQKLASQRLIDFPSRGKGQIASATGPGTVDAQQWMRRLVSE